MGLAVVLRFYNAFFKDHISRNVPCSGSAVEYLRSTRYHHIETESLCSISSLFQRTILRLDLSKYVRCTSFLFSLFIRSMSFVLARFESVDKNILSIRVSFAYFKWTRVRAQATGAHIFCSNSFTAFIYGMANTLVCMWNVAESPSLPLSWMFLWIVIYTCTKIRCALQLRNGPKTQHNKFNKCWKMVAMKMLCVRLVRRKFAFIFTWN